MEEFQTKINEIKQGIEQNPSCEGYAQLGFLLQEIDLKQHSGGVLQRQALQAFRVCDFFLSSKVSMFLVCPTSLPN